jgi:transcriptional regulator with XRE-family HTH domain
MGDQETPNVGSKLRLLRERQGLSIRALAQQCGLSINAISQIERGDHSPTVSSLHMLANALRVPISAFFEDESEKSIVLVRQKDRVGSQAGGVLTESLGIGLQNQQLEPFFVTVEPGAGNPKEPITHLGEEFVHCVEGKIEYCVNDVIYQLETGDSLLFEAVYPHSFYNATQTPTTLLMVFHASSHFFRASGHIDLLSL